MAYTVKQLADLSGVSVRTLHYYDEIDLLRPAHVGANGYRYYDRESLYRLQQILFFRELDVALSTIREVLDSPAFDRLQALEAHRRELVQRVRALNGWITTIDRTIMHLKGELTMSDNELFESFSEEKQAQYEQEMREQYGNARVDDSLQRWNSLSQAQKDAIAVQRDTIFATIRDHMDEGHDSPAVQAQITALQQHIGNYYECTVEGMRGLGQMYVDHPDFVATFERIRPGMAQFLQDAINHYCDTHAE